MVEHVEKQAHKKRVRRDIQRAVLTTIGIAGIIAVMAIAPNLPQALPGIMGKKRYRAQFGYRARTAAGRLAQKGLVRFIERDGKRFAELTTEGKRVLAIDSAKAALAVQKQKRWDKRWRMIIFDIPERRKYVRERLRRTMREMGFLRIQDSVRVFPHDCEELMALLKADLHIGKDVLYAVVEHIENDNRIRTNFGFSPADS